MIYTVTLNPALDKTAQVPSFTLDQVNRVAELRVDPGGKGINVSKVVSKLGGKSLALAVLGGNTGQAIASMLAEQGIEVLAFDPKGETRTNLKVVDEKLDTHTDINEPGPTVSQAFLDDMLSKLVSMISKGDIVCLSGSLPKGAAADTYKTWTAACKQTGAKVFLDADGDKLVSGLEAAPYLTKPNEIELGAILGRELDSDAKVAEAARELSERGVEFVAVSMGGSGGVFAKDGRIVRGVSPKVRVGSTVGAGDSVVAALAFAEEQGMGLEETVRLAMATGAANVMESGTQAAEKSVVDSLIDKVEVYDM